MSSSQPLNELLLSAAFATQMVGEGNNDLRPAKVVSDDSNVDVSLIINTIRVVT
jgi:hypothetical protein